MARVPNEPAPGTAEWGAQLPGNGRVVEGRRRVRMADAGADGRARLDAVARYLHDVAEDDAAGVALPRTVGWVLRSTRLEIAAFPQLGEDLVLRTFCSGTASRWAERTTLVRGAAGARLTAVSIWVALDTATGSPVRLGDWFFSVYGASAGGRRASARLTLGQPDPALLESGRPWPLRRSDVDAWGHVNNAIAWAAVEDAVPIGRGDTVVALLEHHAPIDPGIEPVLAAEQAGDRWSVWLADPSAPAQLLTASSIAVGPGAAPHAPASPR